MHYNFGFLIYMWIFSINNIEILKIRPSFFSEEI